jgi:ATP-dependent helicase/nuclease subunit B
MARARVVVAADAGARLEAAASWMQQWPAAAPVLVIGASWEACDDFVRRIALERGALFGVMRFTLDRLAARLATPALAQAGRVQAGALARTAVTARAVHGVQAVAGFGRFAPVADRPGFALAASRTVDELRMQQITIGHLADGVAGGRDLAALIAEIERGLADAGLADRASVFAAAYDALADSPDLTGIPLLCLDVALDSAAETALLAGLAAAAPDVLFTVPAGDERTVTHLAAACEVTVERPSVPTDSSLARLQHHLFDESAPAPRPLDGTVSLRSWPGEARECVEIARAVQHAAAEGVPFDRMAVLLHAPRAYTAHIEEAFARADLPVFIDRGARRPHAAGRALLALLACAAEGLSARRFAEYLSLGQVPDEAASGGDPWVPPQDDLLPVGDPPAEPGLLPHDDPRYRDPNGIAIVAGQLRAPWRWEQLLVDASVIGRRERWVRRLDGLGHQIERQRGELAEEDEGRAAQLDRTRRDLEHLRGFALPLIDRLAALPTGASWGEWLDHLCALAPAALREPIAVLTALAELAPMAPVGPVDLDEVRMVLDPRLRDVTQPAPRRRYGAVFVGPTSAARGMVFDLVFVPGLAEKVFPGKIVEDPILLDADRERLSDRLITQPGRVAAERLALRIAAGAARERLVLSFPRIDVEQARPRVPSFYALECLRAAEGSLLGFEALSARAGAGDAGRLGWPAPASPADAIDEAEYDLALLAPLLDADPDTTAGTARYLVSANPHLARALRSRARRWLRRWTVNDGLVDPDPAAVQALARHQMSARAFSPTALQQFAACPYRFFLQAIHRLQPFEEPGPLETMDALTRGSMFHDVQFGVLSQLRDQGQLPMTEANVDAGRAAVDQVLTRVAARYADDLAPAIQRVWDDGVVAVRADLREWIRRQVETPDGWTPARFELAFGLADRDRPHSDPASVDEPVVLLGGALKLRGSIDLVERQAESSVLRATDHKTGKVYAADGVVVGGGKILQPVLYALALEKLLHGPVESGRLYYCTADGGYATRTVQLDEASRAAAADVAAIVGRALAAGFLPAAPEKDGCRYCDYRPVCGPYEELRSGRKPVERLADLQRLRSLP